MRCFVPATDDEIYTLIERYGFHALVAYRCGMHLGVRDELAPVPAINPSEGRFWSEMPESAPRQAA